jgi:hypothetical protein
MVYTEEHVKKLIDLAFLKGKEAAMLIMINQINRTIGEYNDAQSKGDPYYPITERKEANTFLSTLCR